LLERETGVAIPREFGRLQKWSEHFVWSQDRLRIIGVTAVGLATLLKLNLNRQGLLNLRAVLKLAGKHLLL
jgi:hypothetical protein